MNKRQNMPLNINGIWRHITGLLNELHFG